MNPPPMVKSHKLLNWTEPLTTILEEKGRKKRRGGGRRRRNSRQEVQSKLELEMQINRERE